MSTLLQYTNLVKEQNKINKYPKIHYVFPLSKLTYSKDFIIDKVLKNSVICTGVIKTKSPLYFNETTSIYYEFLHPINNNNIYVNWNYYYVNVEELDNIKSKVPFITLIDFETGVSKRKYLSFNTMLRKNISKNVIEVNSFLDNKHPILNHFLFTGKIAVFNNTICYEYFDVQELYDSVETKYLSLEAPINFRSNWGLTYKKSIYNQGNAVPCNLAIKNKVRRLEFTGEMNNTLLKNKVLYKYIETIEGENYIVLFEEKPFYGSSDLIQDVLGLDKVININSQGSSRIKIKQTSNVNLKIDKL